MFLNKKFILANELVQKMGIHIANISMLRQEFEDRDLNYDMQKRASCTFINTKSRHLPHNIMVGILANQFTDMSDKVPQRWFAEEYGITAKQLNKAGILKDTPTIAGKKFYQFTEDFVKQVSGKITYTLDKEETEYCLKHNQIEGYVQVGSNKFLTWY